MHTRSSPTLADREGPPIRNLAALQTCSENWQEILAKLRVDLIAVRFVAPLGSPVWAQQSPVHEALGAALEQARAGAFDSSYWKGQVQIHFFHCWRFAPALAAIKDALQTLELLDLAEVYHGEFETGLWRQYLPPTANLIDL
jgi:hypothetical protein